MSPRRIDAGLISGNASRLSDERLALVDPRSEAEEQTVEGEMGRLLTLNPISSWMPKGKKPLIETDARGHRYIRI
jgi:hypothetical protein